ncbi:MAG: hypothetical protein OXB93_04265 [Cytophagales bacterium]|nr:hypothetical protein [Cytophagales bacterium]
MLCLFLCHCTQEEPIPTSPTNIDVDKINRFRKNLHGIHNLDLQLILGFSNTGLSYIDAFDTLYQDVELKIDMKDAETDSFSCSFSNIELPFLGKDTFKIKYNLTHFQEEADSIIYGLKNVFLTSQKLFSDTIKADSTSQPTHISGHLHKSKSFFHILDGQLADEYQFRLRALDVHTIYFSLDTELKNTSPIAKDSL